MLYAESFGHGPDLVMVHGWAMHGGMLRSFASRLARSFRITLIDLPGHGHSEPVADPSAQGIVSAILERVPERAHWLGWSLGGLLSLQAILLDARVVRRLVLMAGTPRFVAEERWPGVDSAVLHRFAAELDEDSVRCLTRFLALQLATLADARSDIKALQGLLAERPPPDSSGLHAGLDLLSSLDLRQVVTETDVPILAVLGQRDRLVPPSTGTALKRLNANVEVQILDGASHLPFLTHTETAARHVEDFLLRNGE